MKSHARVVVVGGGIVGVSVLYHLAKAGWSDVVLCEKIELTSGSTWHAAGLLPLFNMSYCVGQMHWYSVNMYKQLEAETGQPVGFHQTGNLRLATNQERMDEYYKYSTTANTIGVPYHFITPQEVKEIWPPCNIDGIVGALLHPEDGHVDPSSVTQAMAKGARTNGAEIYRQTEVLAMEQKPNGEWLVKTNQGDITCEYVVTASGNYARETAAMVGLDIPVIPVEHQFIVTEEIPELVERAKQGLPEMAVLRESDQSYYMREERQGLILGPYEKGAPCCWEGNGVPEGFGQELLPPDIDRLAPHIEAAINRVPIFGEAGVKDCVNGPISYTPDGNPLCGPAPGLKNFFLAEGFSFGITSAGGAGRHLAEWIMEGEPSIDMLPVDPRRFGAYANKPYTMAKNEECYEHVFVIHYPFEERPAARPAKTSPCYDRMDALRAVWGQRYGWERPGWFAPEGVEAKDVYSFRRNRNFGPVGAECRMVRENVGLLDLTGFTKHVVSGPGAVAYLDNLTANKLPKVGRSSLAHALTRVGTVETEFTITRLAEDRFYLVSSGGGERHDNDVLWRALPDDGSVRLDNITTSKGVLILTGPKARDVLAKCTDADLSNKAFPWLTGQEITVGMASVLALRINFVGELGWELHHPIEYQNHIFDTLMAAGEEFGMGPYGMFAMESLRLEKSYRMWGMDLTRDYSAWESGLDRFVKLDKGDFVGRDALVKQKDEGFPRRFVTIEVDADDADCLGSEPLYQGDRLVGRVTSAAYGHMVGKSLAMGYVEAAAAAPGTALSVEILDQRRPAKVIEHSPWDPDNARSRA